jgi:hypothetical protein
VESRLTASWATEDYYVRDVNITGGTTFTLDTASTLMVSAPTAYVNLFVGWTLSSVTTETPLHSLTVVGVPAGAVPYVRNGDLSSANPAPVKIISLK